MQKQLGIDGGAEARRGPVDRIPGVRPSYRPAARRPATPAPLTDERLARLSKQLIALGEAVTRRLADTEHRSQHQVELLREELRRTQEALHQRLDGSARAHAAVQTELGRITDMLLDRLDASERRAGEGLQALEDRLNAVEAAAEARQAEASGRLLHEIAQSEALTADRIAVALAGRPAAEAASSPSATTRRGRWLYVGTGGAAALAIAIAALLAWKAAPPARPVSVKVEAAAEPAPRSPSVILLRAPQAAAVQPAARPPKPSLSPRPAPRASVHAAAPAKPDRPPAAALAPQLPTQADKLRAMAEHGDPRAALGVAELYAKGQGGLARDPAQARRWKAVAAQAGYAPAMHNLGVDYLRGEGGPQDPAAAAQWFRMAAEKGFTDSAFNLGVLYEAGQGVPRDLAQARKWYAKAAAAGDTGAADRLAALGPGPAAPVAPLLTRKPQAPPKDGAAIATSRPTAASAEIIEIQQKLARLGFYLGPIDGTPSAELDAAVEAYNRGQAGRSGG